METTTTSVPYKDFLRLPHFIYMSFGYDFMQLPKPIWQRIAMGVLLAWAISAHIIGKLFMFVNMYELICSKDPLEAFRLSIFISFAIDANIKFFAFIINSDQLRRIHKTLSDKYPKTQEELELHRVDQHYWPFSARFIVASYYGVCSFILSMPLLQSCVQYMYEWLIASDGSSVQFAYLKTVPIIYHFNYRKPSIYAGLFFFEMMIGHTANTTNMGTDLWLVGFTMQLCMYLEYIGRRLREYVPDEQNEIADCEFLKDLMEKHQELLSLHQDFNDIFGISLAFNLISSTWLLCSIAVYVMMTDGIGLFPTPWLLLLFIVIAQLYLLYNYGQKLIEASQSIATAAYSAQWYNGSKTYKGLLLMIMMRAQKQAELSAIGFLRISQDTFKMIMGVTYRVVALLRTILK